MSIFIRKTLPAGPLQANCTIIGNAETREAIVIDAGGDALRIKQQLDELGLTCVAIVHTHAHLDHIMGCGQLKELTGADIYAPAADKNLWDNLQTQCQMFGLPYTSVPQPDHWFEDHAKLPLNATAIFTPGHTEGSTCIWFEDEKLLVAGDTLFRRAVGRTDLWGGDYATLERSIKTRLYTLDPATVVVAGHGPDTTIGEEMRENMVIRA